MTEPTPARGRPRQLIVPVLAAAAGLWAAAAVPASPAVLGVQDDRMTSGPPEEIPERVAMVRASGAKVARMDVLWSLAAPERPAAPRDPSDPAYRWERVDAVLQGLARAGVTPILVVYSAPPWAAGGAPIPEGTEVNPQAPAPRHFRDFMAALATRYTGRYVPDGADRPLPRVRHFELWNEPNLASFLSPQTAGGRRVAIGRYVAMVRAAYPAIKRVNRSSIVLAGVGGPRSSTDARGVGALEWARALARSDAPFDAYSQHVYPAAAPTAPTRAFPAWRTLPQLFGALDAVPRRRGTPVYITEFGYTTMSTPFRDVRVTERQQAAYLRQIMRLPQVRNGRVRALIWFNLQDNRNWPAGLRRLNKRTKPSHRVFVPLARASRLTPDLRVDPPVTLSARQLLINQRISQAAVRRLNAIERELDGGLSRADLRPRAFGAGAFGDQVQAATDPGAERTTPPALRREPLRARSATGPPGRVRLTAGQLRINQRISQAAVRRANALERRLDGNLTGGDLLPGAVGPAHLADGVGIVRADPDGARPAPSSTRVAPPTGASGRVVLSARQLMVNQRIGQAGVRRANALADALAKGVWEENFAPGSLGAANLDPSLRGGPAGG